MRDILSSIFVVVICNYVNKLHCNSALHDGDFICLNQEKRFAHID